ncbi:DUF1353 domain-containing protein [Terriglobus aquaticus]|nr:DUF1353 domain-containing protein [Terriglobus aquaticus]
MTGHYEGKVVATWLSDGRNMQIEEPFAYIDIAELRWDVPAEARVDGASIPRFLWTLLGGPFEGKYRDASVVHDWYCDVRTRPWRAVHRMFFEAMLTSGVGTSQAKMMYAGVMLGGPKWSENAVSNAILSQSRALIATRRESVQGKSQGEHAGAVFQIAASIDHTGLADTQRDPLIAFADDLAIRPARLAKLLQTRRGSKQPQKLAVRYRPSQAKAERVVQSATDLDLDGIDAMIERETKGLKLMAATQ